MKADLAGQVFGDITVIGKSAKKGTGVFYTCLCGRCGTTKDIRATKLRGGNNKTCGCGRIAPDLTGQTFNRLTAVKRLGSKNGQVLWECLCDCGNKSVVAGPQLANGSTKSCGCLRVEVSTGLCKALSFRHGMTDTATHKSWDSMKLRCINPAHNSYRNYGGRGISICDRWLGIHGFENFHADMGDRPRGMTLDRIDVDGNYEPSNCRWATLKEQHRNTRTNRLITFNGETKTVTEFAEIHSINVGTLRSRLQNGWDVETAITAPVRKNQYA